MRRRFAFQCSGDSDRFPLQQGRRNGKGRRGLVLSVIQAHVSRPCERRILRSLVRKSHRSRPTVVGSSPDLPLTSVYGRSLLLEAFEGFPRQLRLAFKESYSNAATGWRRLRNFTLLPQTPDVPFEHVAHPRNLQPPFRAFMQRATPMSKSKEPMSSETSPVERPSASARLEDVSASAAGPDRSRGTRSGPVQRPVEEIAPEVGALWIMEEPLGTRKMLDTIDYSVRSSALRHPSPDCADRRSREPRKPMTNGRPGLP
ncbi:hypothetical protein SAMN04489742_4900 [Arthrobacter crystallopoietes]|uniref:Uncharacterized protein n=1 Tax=Crystallibacter crystallopoietes TaxID=37928 RepID=A0A1H1I0X6_9MICC|nr:hypothetical protein SAMN04489742_4900 [Arthrobacter crystallopoietes]